MKKWKKVFCALMAGIMVAAIPVQAAVLDQEVKANIETNDVPPWPKASEIAATSGLLMEYSTGTVIYSQGADQRIDPASLTKIMSILVAVENSAFTDTVTFTEACLAKANPESNLGLMAGETLTMEQCLKVMALDKAYEISCQVAELLGPTEAQFVVKMNEKAKALGCENTNFTNASGLANPNQYTTAKDMAKILRAGMKNKLFRQVFRTPKFKVAPTNLNGMERVLSTYHPIRSKRSSIFDQDCIGGMCSETLESGASLATAVKKNNVIYLSVVFKDIDINQAGVDTQYMMKYGYENFQKISVEGGCVVIPNGMSVADLQITEKKAGEKTRQFYAVDNHRVGRGSKLPQEEVQPVQTEGQEGLSMDGENKSPVEEAKANGLSDTARMLLGVMVVMVIILVILCILLAIKDYKESRYYED